MQVSAALLIADNAVRVLYVVCHTCTVSSSSPAAADRSSDSLTHWRIEPVSTESSLHAIGKITIIASDGVA